MKTNLSRIASLIDSSDQWKLDKPPYYEPIDINGKPGVVFYWPNKIGINKADGYRLKDCKGFISMSETYIYVNETKNRIEKTAHVYKYTALDTYYIACNSNDSEETIFYYNFHYDEDLDYDQNHLHDENRHPTNHIQILHSHPRFSTDQALVGDFLTMVKRTCFNDSGYAYKEPIYRINSVA